MTLSPMENVLNRLDKRHSSSSSSSSSSSKKKAKRPCTKDPSTKTTTTIRVPFGHFRGTEIYRNRIVGAEPEELASDGHYSIEELVLPHCSSAVCTTFQAGGITWLQKIFAHVDQLLVLEPPPHEGPTTTSTGPTIGNAQVSPMMQKTDLVGVDGEGERRPKTPIPNWFWVQARPHTGGCLHAKVLLFRSEQGLRVVICGGNLYRGQWEHHRDVYWVQDFPVAKDDRIGFGDSLWNFLTQVTRCADVNDQATVTSRMEGLFDKIDFSAAKAQLVISFPRTREEIAAGLDCGGWKQLAVAAHDAMLASGMGEDDDENDENDPHLQQLSSNRSSSVLYANSGSMGNVEPDFLLQMHQAMNGGNQLVSRDTGWEDVVNRVHCLWPSIATACKMDLLGLKGACRHIPRRVLNKIKRRYRNEIFRDALPNPPTLAVFDRQWRGFGVAGDDDASKTQKFHPATHGKFMWNDQGVLYVGSHNFSKAAWGLHNAQPKNVEVGVVLATPKFLPATPMPIPNPTYQLWQHRLPCKLDAQPSPFYAAYAGIGDLIDQHPLGHLWKRVVKKFQEENPNLTEEQAIEIGPTPGSTE